VRADVRFLPFKDGSVRSVEAYHLLEHFDAAHARVVLWECNRVLSPEGTMVLETPDTEKAFKRLLASDRREYHAKLQWIYGIDSPGLGHKTGFTKTLLESILRETSFDKVVFETPKTHTYEPGLRVICRKREPDSEIERAIARAINALVLDRRFDDSHVLIPLREELVKLSKSSSRVDPSVLSRACVLNPMVALALQSAAEHGGQSPSAGFRMEVMKRLGEQKLNEKAFTLWKKSVKTRGDMREFDEFAERLSRDVGVCLRDAGNDMDALAYVLSLPPSPVMLMSHALVSCEGQRTTGHGIKLYASYDYADARKAFDDALATNPQNFVAAWNSARLLANSDGKSSEAKEAYRRAAKLAPKILRDVVTSESEAYENSGSAPNVPFSY